MSKKLFIIKNTEENKTFINTLKYYLRNTSRSIRVYGRGKRNGNDKFISHLPISLSESLAVYLEDKPSSRLVRNPITNRSEFKPTKWAWHITDVWYHVGVGDTYPPSVGWWVPFWTWCLTAPSTPRMLVYDGTILFRSEKEYVLTFKAFIFSYTLILILILSSL